MMVKMGDADGMVSGACHSTADTLETMSADPEDKARYKVSIRFLRNGSAGLRYGCRTEHLYSADCGLEQNPDPEKLAAIALSSAESFRASDR